MKTKSVLRFFSLIAALSLFAAACSDDDESASKSTSESENTLEVCDGEIDTPVEIKLTSHSSGDAYTKSVADFNNGPGADLGVTVELVDLGETGYEDFIKAAAASEDLPDIIDMDGPFLYNFAWNQFVQPFGNCAEDVDLDDFLPSIIEQGTYNDELYSLGSFDSGLGLWAKRSDLESVEARIPESSSDAWTVEEFDKILRDLQAAGKTAPLDIKWWYGAGEWRSYGYAPMIQSAGGDIIDRSNFQSADGVLNGPESVKALTQFQTWGEDGLIDLEAADDNNFIEGDASISWVGHWMYNPYKEAIGDDLVLLPLPDFGEGSKTGMGSLELGYVSTTVDPDAAWAFIEFVTSAEQVEKIAAEESAVPSRKSVLEKDASFQEGGDRYLYVENLENSPSVAVPRPATGAYGVIRDSLSTAIGDILTGADVQETLDEAVKAFDQDIEDTRDIKSHS